MKCLFAIFLLFILSACETTTGLYSWGGYQDNLYEYYDKPDKRLRVLSRLEKHVQKLEAGSRRVPPGLYAEIGTFYLEMGDQVMAVEYYKKEMEAWPESRGLMTVLISNLESRTVIKEESDAS